MLKIGIPSIENPKYEFRNQKQKGKYKKTN